MCSNIGLLNQALKREQRVVSPFQRKAQEQSCPVFFINKIFGKTEGVLVKSPLGTGLNIRFNIVKCFFYDRLKSTMVKGRQKINCIRSIATKCDAG